MAGGPTLDSELHDMTEDDWLNITFEYVNYETFWWDKFYNDQLYDYTIQDDRPQDTLKVFATIFYCLIFCISLPGNTFLLWVLLRSKDLKRTSNLFLLHLTVSDLMVILPLPFWASQYYTNNWAMGDAMCKLLCGVRSLGLYGYMIFLMAMTVHRYRAVLLALTASTSMPHVQTLCCTLWLFCFFFSVPEMMSAKVENTNNTVYCKQSYRSTSTECFVNYMQIIMFFLLPFAIITFCYTRMWLRIRQCRIKKKNKAMRLIFLTVVGFFICWAPYNVFVFILLLSLQGLISKLNNTAAFQFSRVISYSLTYLHCGLSPLIHVFGAEKFRKRLPLPFIKTPGSETESQRQTPTLGTTLFS